MTLNVGTQLGAFKIAGQIGAGGMGEVYRATDSKLGRDVAIKTLPEALAADKDRLARFEREAKLLASLHHAHIASVFSLDEYDGTLYIAMELVEGQTLEEKLKPGALPVEDALRLALQIAEALEAAHAKGVVHRDLKPANVMVTPDGVVKVLDFGLAKAFSDDTGQPGPEHSPALSLAMTQAGLVLGTAGYMSPEQASGQPTDQRADIWAFGVVLFEMLTGMPVFKGESVPHIVAAVLQLEPDWGRLPDNLHPRIRSMLERCLEKKLRSRYTGIADARTDIEAALHDPEGLTPAARAARIAAPMPRRLLSASGLIAIGAFAALLFAWVFTPSQDSSSVNRLSMVLTGDQALQPATYGRSLAISPDGRQVAYVSGGGALMIRAVGDWESRTLVPPGDVAPAESPFFSPDGQRVGYFAQNIGVYRVQAQGGPRTEVASLDFDNGSPGGATWAGDGTIVFATLNSAGLYLLPPESTEPQVLTTPNAAAGEADHLWPEYLPGDRAVLFTITAANGLDADAQVAVLDLDTGDYSPVVPGGSDAHYVATGHLLYTAAGQLRAIPFDLGRRQTTGPSAIVEQGRTVRMSTSLAGDYDVADDGTLIYLSADDGSAQGNRRMVWVNRAQQVEALDIEPRTYLYPRLSEDGNRVLLDVREGENDIWLLDLRVNQLTDLTRHPALDRFPIWQDADHFIFVRDFEVDGETGTAIFRQRIDDPTSAEQVSDPSPSQQTPNAVTPDGSQLVFDREGDLFLLELDGSRQATPLIETPLPESRSSLAPDGRWLAYQRQQSDGRIDVIVRAFPLVTDDRGTLVSGGVGGLQPWWSPVGDELFFFAPTGDLMGVRIGSNGDWSDSRAYLVLEANDFTFAGVDRAAPTFDVAEDSQRFLVVQNASGGDSSSRPIAVVQNWLEQLERLVPTD